LHYSLLQNKRTEWKNPKFEYRNPCLRRSGYAQAGETNPKSE
jgi:hypothetical protein